MACNAIHSTTAPDALTIGAALDLDQDQDNVAAGLAKKMSDGVTDLACADQCYAALAAGLVSHDHSEAFSAVAE